MLGTGTVSAPRPDGRSLRADTTGRPQWRDRDDEGSADGPKDAYPVRGRTTGRAKVVLRTCDNNNTPAYTTTLPYNIIVVIINVIA